MYFAVTDPPGQPFNLDTVTSLADLKKSLANINIVAVILTLDNVQYLAVKGNAKINLLKNNQEITVITSTGEVVGASGKTNKNNQFILYAGNEKREYVYIPPSPAPNIYLKKINFEKFEEIKNKISLNKKALGIIAVVIFLIYAVFRQVSYRLENDKGLRTDREITKVEEKIAVAMELAQLNKALAKGNLETEKANLLKFDGDKKKIAAEIVKIEAKINEVLEINVVTPEVFYDFSLAKEGVTGGPAVYLNGKLSLLDKNSGSLLLLDVKNKSAKVLATDDKFKDGTFITDDYIFTGLGVYNTKKTLVIKTNPKWQEIVGMGFYGGNIYLLDIKANQIWKHIGAAGDARNYLAADVKADFSQSTRMAINGSILVAAGDKVQKFTSGRQADFTLIGLDKPIGKITRVFASDELKNIYLFDEPNKRVIVVSDAGQYQSQFILNSSFTFSSLFADEALSKLFFLSGVKVYSVGLK